jgi:hypothetical protein
LPRRNGWYTKATFSAERRSCRATKIEGTTQAVP